MITRRGAGTLIRGGRAAWCAGCAGSLAIGRKGRMTAEQVVLDSGSFWALVGLIVLVSVVGLVAAVAAWRSAKSSKAALGALETARRELVVTEREWQERSPVPRRAEDASRLAPGAA